ncbi:MAG TPA: SDR family NAD(P)-dependent oxidoreductase [Candidatus Dormibacteraeota bacterium]|jgi:3-oxoacyl-[acyl-carrier protein] reductase
MDFRGRVALVTGGGTGIGRAVAESLGRAGARAVVINYSRSQEEAEATATALGEMGVEGVPWRADVADERDVRDMVSGVVERLERLDVLVNNAGTTHFIPQRDLEALTDQVWDDILRVNLKGTFYCSRASAPHLRQAHGAIVNVTSIAGMRATGSSIAYGVSKAGVEQLTRNLALALAPEVRVNAVAPGQVATRWFRRPFGEQAADDLEQRRADSTPLRGVATPEHIAQAIMGLLAADFVTGQTLVVDGGASINY